MGVDLGFGEVVVLTSVEFLPVDVDVSTAELVLVAEIVEFSSIQILLEDISVKFCLRSGNTELWIAYPPTAETLCETLTIGVVCKLATEPAGEDRSTLTEDSCRSMP